MGTRNTADDPKVALYDSTAGWAFGPTFESAEEAESFRAFAQDMSSRDIRTWAMHELETAYMRWQMLPENGGMDDPRGHTRTMT